MSDTAQWDRLYHYLDKRFKAVDDLFEAVDQRFNQVVTMIDNLTKRVDDDDVERKAMIAQLDRHEVRILQLESDKHS